VETQFEHEDEKRGDRRDDGSPALSRFCHNARVCTVPTPVWTGSGSTGHCAL